MGVNTMTEKFIITYKYSPSDLIFICTKQMRLEHIRNIPTEVWKYCVEMEITPGYEGDTRYKKVEFRLDDKNCTVEPYTDKYKIDLDQNNYLKRLGL